MKKGRHAWGTRGFTLIELLMVVVVMAILVGILLPVLGKTKRKTRIKQAQTTVRELSLAIRTYHFEHQSWPVPDPGPPDRTYGLDNHEIVAKLVNAVPPAFARGDHRFDGQGSIIDPWQNAYNIRIDKDYDGIYLNTANTLPDGCSVWSLGPDGVDGTADDIR